MAIKPEVFLAIEGGLVAYLLGVWGRQQKGWLLALYRALKARDYPAAYAQAAALDLSTLAEVCREYLKYSSQAAMVYGATRLVEDPYRLQLDKAPILPRAIAAFQAALTGSVATTLRQGFTEMIAQQEAEDQAGAVFKAEDVAERVVRSFVSFREVASDLAQRTLQLTASLHTSRLAAYGFTAEAELRGLTQYQWLTQLDDRACPICSENHGKVFQVEDARESLDTLLYVTNPQDLKTLHPWPKQDKVSLAVFREMTPAQRTEHNWNLPPLHPLCRCVLVATEEDKHKGIDRPPPVDPFVSVVPGEDIPFIITQRDFATVQAHLRQVQDALPAWNAGIKIYPSEFLSQITGLPAKLLIETAGQYNLTVEGLAQSTLGIFFIGQAFQSTLKFNQMLDFATQEVVITTLQLEETGPLAAQAVGSLLKSMVAFYQERDLLGVSVDALQGLGGAEWLHLGFLPASTAEWVYLKARLLARLQSVSLTPGEQAAVFELLQDANPKVLWQMVDQHPQASQALLNGLSWKCHLDLGDPDAMTRFDTLV